jgi:formylmethanofuran dehydrogenase subunit E
MEDILHASAALHRHLGPHQVLGVRMGIAAGRLFGLALPRGGRRLLTIVETDGCFADGVAVATGCWIGRRTLRLEDFGKVAATFVDADTGRSVRMAPSAAARALAAEYAPEARSRWETYLFGYQRMSESLLLVWQPVTLRASVAAIVSRADRRAVCQICREEIINGREVRRAGVALCRACAGQAYYTTAQPAAPTVTALEESQRMERIAG